MRLTVAQALVRFLAAQHVERDGQRRRFFAGCLGIFGHGNVAGLGQALQQHHDLLPYHPARNEQAMVHQAAGYARQRNRLGAWACTSSVGPGATNMVTGAALATINRLPVLLLPGDTFATRAPHPVLQQLEAPHDATVSVNDCFRPVSRFFDRITRPEQIVSAALEAMRVLTDPAETGTVTLALPEDVQTEAVEGPAAFLEPRVWTVYRRPPAREALARAAELVRDARRPLIVAGGGVIYSEATDALAAFAAATGIPVGETQAGRGAMRSDHPLSLGATGTAAANRLAREADLVIGVGTRWSDFTTASKSAFQDPDVRFVNVNVAGFDAAKQSALAVEADVRLALEELQDALAGYHVEYGYSCMGYEIPGGMGVKLAAPEREVFVMIGDGSYLMLPGELPTAVAEGIKLVIVLVQNHGYSSIGGLSRAIGAAGFGTLYHSRANGSVPTDEAPAEPLPIDLAANAESLGARVIRARTIDDVRAGLLEARAADGPVVVHVEVDRYEGEPSYESWWDVPVAEVASDESVRAAREEYERARQAQRQYVESP